MKETVIDNLKSMFSDTSVDTDETISDLKEIMEELEVLIDALENDQ